MREDLNKLIAISNASFFQQRRVAGYLARTEIESIKSKLPPDRLEHYGYKVYSQNDEDGIIEEIFNRLGIAGGNFVEIGVENGLECNSLYLIHKGWHGVWLEANTDYCDFIAKKFTGLLNAKRLILGKGFVYPNNLNEAITQCANAGGLDQTGLDFLSGIQSSRS